MNRVLAVLAVLAVVSSSPATLVEEDFLENTASGEVLEAPRPVGRMIDYVLGLLMDEARSWFLASYVAGGHTDGGE